MSCPRRPAWTTTHPPTTPANALLWPLPFGEGPGYLKLAAAVVVAAAAVATTVAAAIAAAAVVGDADAAHVTAAAEQDQQDDDPQTAVATEAVIVAHRRYLQEIFGAASPLIPCYDGAGIW